MKASFPALRALLNTQQFFKCDLYTFELNDGTVLRYTDADGDITIDEFSRSSVATYTDSFGKMITAAIDEPRFTHDQVSLAPLGMLYETASTNAIFNTSTTASVAVVSTGTAINPKGDLAYKVVPNAGAVAFPSRGNSAQKFTNSTTVGQTSDYSFTGYFDNYGPLNYKPLLVMVADDGAANQLYALIQFDTVTGVFSVKSFNAGWSEISAPTALMMPCGMWKVSWSVRFTQQALLRTRIGTFFQIRNEAGLASYTADGLSGVQYAFMQFENRAVPSSYIPTTTVSATRAADNIEGFRRASTALVVNSFGAIVTAAIDEPRFAYDPVTLTPLGWLYEDVATNILTYSVNLLQASWFSIATIFTTTVSTLLFLDGTLNAFKLIKTAGGDSVCLRKSVSHVAGDYVIALWIYVPTQAGITSFALKGDWQDLNNGAVSPQCTIFGRWVRLESAVTLSTTRTWVDFNLVINGTNNPTTGMEFHICYPQEETGLIATSTIVTGATAGTRAADIPNAIGTTFESTGPLITRGSTRLVPGLEVDTLDVNVMPQSSDMLGGIPFPQFAQNGGFDGALFNLDRVFMSTWGDTSCGIVPMFSGQVAEVTPSRSAIALSIKSMIELLNTMMPHRLYQPNCSHSLFDQGCGLSKAAFAVNDSATAGSTSSTINCGLTQAANYFKLGTMLWLTGNNAGATRTIKSYTPGVIGLSLPLQFIPAPGDTFTIYPGCDKKQKTCGGVGVIYTVDPTTDIFTSANTYYGGGTAFTVSNSGGSLPGGLSAGVTYYTLQIDADTWKASLTVGGAAINITSAGTGTQVITPTSKFDNIINFHGFPYTPIPETAL